MFSLDESLHFIDAAEEDIIAIHRSVAAVVVAPKGNAPVPCEAFVCEIGKNHNRQVYVALRSTAASGGMFFYTPGASFKHSREDALKFAATMGFAMEETDLKYGRALREVIIRSTKLFHPPPSDTKKVAKPAPSKATLEASFEEGPTISLDLEDGETDKPDVDIILAEKLAAEKRAHAQEQQARDILTKAEQRKSQRDQLLMEKAEAERRELEQIEAVRVANERIKAELAEREKILAYKIAAEQRAKEQAQAARLALEQMEATRKQREKLLQEMAEAKQLADEQLALEIELRAQIEAARVEQEALVEKVRADRLAAEQAEKSRLAMERALAEQSEKGRLEKEQLEREQLEREQLERERIEKERIEKERIEKERIEKERIEKERIEKERIEKERIEVEQRASQADILADKARAARAECEDILLQQAQAEIAAAEKADSYSQEVESIAAERDDTERTYAATAAASDLQSQKIKVARLDLEKTERERAEHEDVLDRIRADENAAIKELEAARLKLQEAQNRRAKGEAVVAEKISAVGSASKTLEIAQLEWEKTEKARLNLEKLLLEQTEQVEIVTRQLEEARISLKKLTAARVEREQLLSAFRDAEEAALQNVELLQTSCVATAGVAEENPAMPSAMEPPVLEHGKTAPPQEKIQLQEIKGQETAPVEKPVEVEKHAEDLAKAARPLIVAPGSGPEQPQALVRPANPINPEIPEDSPFFNPIEATAIVFSIDYTLEFIPLEDDDEVLSLHQSMNAVRLSTEGFPSQNCTAYFCALANQGIIRAYFALHLAESRKNLVYVPDRRPMAIDEINLFIDEGLRFAETVGFLMDGAGLDGNERLKVLGKAPFRRGCPL